jgi:hypothetical protein
MIFGTCSPALIFFILKFGVSRGIGDHCHWLTPVVRPHTDYLTHTYPMPERATRLQALAPIQETEGFVCHVLYSVEEAIGAFRVGIG